MIRGFLARRRVAALREEMAAKARSRAVTPPPTPPKKEVTMRGVEVRLNGTEVMVVPHLVGGGDDITICDCAFEITEKNTNKTATLVISSPDMQILWDKFLLLPLNFQRALLRVRRVGTANLQNVELFGQNDPFVVLSFGDLWSGQTSTVQDGGASAEWEFRDDEQASMQFDICRQDILDNILKVSVSDENKFRSHVVIGEATVDLTELIHVSSYGKEVKFAATLSNRKGKEVGTVTLSADLLQTDGAEIYRCESLEVAWGRDDIRNAFITHVAENYMDLFLSRGSSVMIVRLKSLA